MTHPLDFACLGRITARRCPFLAPIALFLLRRIVRAYRADSWPRQQRRGATHYRVCIIVTLYYKSTLDPRALYLLCDDVCFRRILFDPAVLINSPFFSLSLSLSLYLSLSLSLAFRLSFTPRNPFCLLPPTLIPLSH